MSFIFDTVLRRIVCISSIMKIKYLNLIIPMTIIIYYILNNNQLLGTVGSN